MADYTPDKWIMIKISHSGTDTYKILAGWGGGYLYGQSWKLNSGCTKVEQEGDYFLFSGYSGSVYRCHKQGYGTTSYSAQILNGFLSDAEKAEVRVDVMPEDTNWLEINYGE